MKKLKIFVLTLLTVTMGLSLNGQTIIDLRLNEVLTNNVNSCEDEYGNHPAWLEVFNTSYNSVNIGGCYLTNDTTGIAKAQSGDKAALDTFKTQCYHIPAGDPATLMPQRSCLLFYLDGQSSRGTFHVNFTIDTSKANYIALIGSDGKTLIDIIKFKRLKPDQSFGCEEDGKVAENRDNSIFAKKNNDDLRKVLKDATPGSNNKVLSGEGKADKLAKNDPHGWQMALMSMTIVFSVLFIIFIVLKIFGWYSKKELERKNKKEAKKEDKKAQASKKTAGQPTEEELAAIALAIHRSCPDAGEEEIAAIALALYLYLDTQHDQESEVITFNTQSNMHWGQKQFNFKQDPR